MAERDRLRRTMPDIAAEVGTILADEFEQACAIVRENLSVVEDLAARLHRDGVVDGAEVEQMMKASADRRRAWT
ncbi:hypothetical protein TAL182_CH01968 [Rhizobium sp. TAL182]|nr:hypothetical protein TAL182_CH01968 [Rhizobium sp. TAL182]